MDTASLTTEKEKTFTDPNSVIGTYIEVSFKRGLGIGGANDKRGWDYILIELFRWSLKARLRESITFDLKENYENGKKANEFYDAIVDYKTAYKKIKEMGL